MSWVPMIGILTGRDFQSPEICIGAGHTSAEAAGWDFMRWGGIIVAALVGPSALAGPCISEFMAGDQSVLADEDGEYGDWIEIYNPDTANVSLQGWYLTDSAANPMKWRFPAVTLNARSNLVVFASGKDRTSTVSRLHTNFKLSKDGEYLALVRSNGVTVVQAFAPEFPEQRDNISYGVALPVVTETLVATGTLCRVMVPTGMVEGTWRDIAFDDSAWTTGAFAVGYFSNATPNFVAQVGLDVGSMRGLRTSVFVRSPLLVTNPASVRFLTLRMRYDDGFACYLNGRPVASANAPLVLTNTSAATALHDATAYSYFDLSLAATNFVPGTNILALHGLNQSLSSSDLFLLPQLIAGYADGSAPQTNFFRNPTPGLVNGGADTLQLPQTVSFHPPAGVFTGLVTVTLSGEIDGQTIRYQTNGTMPAATSTLYTSSIVLTNTAYLRACVAGPRGEAGEVTSALYTLASPAAAAFQSELPLVLLGNVDPSRQGSITQQDVKVACWAYVMEPTNGICNLTNSARTAYRAGVSPRGSSTGAQPKKSYAMEFWDEDNNDDGMPLLGMAEEADWVLYGPYYYDRTFMHNVTMFELSRQIGRWAPRTRFVEVFLVTNMTKRLETNDYLGLYVAMEKIDISPDRVDIPSMSVGDVAEPQVSGGYVFKIDRADADEFSWKTTRGNPTNAGSMLVLTSEKAAKLPAAQRTYLTNTVQAFEDALYSPAFTNPATGYAAHTDVASWIDHSILNVLAKNVDALRLSAYLFKDRRELISCGPVWDFDRALGSYDGRDADPTQWRGTGDATDYFTYGWWRQFFLDPDFHQRWIDRWQELRRGALASTNLLAVISSNAAAIGTNAPVRDVARWGNAPSAAHGTNFSGEIAYLKKWVTNRAAWIDQQFAAPPAILPADGVVTAGQLVTMSGSNIIFALDGIDPRAAGGAVAAGASAYMSPFALTGTTYAIARTLNGTNWSGPVRALFLVDETFATTGDLAVTEVNYHPLGASPAELVAVANAQPEDFEFLELRNVGTRRVNLYGCTMTDGAPVNPVGFAPFSLATGEFAVVASHRNALGVRHGTGWLERVAAVWSDGTLADAGERITLLDRTGGTVFSFDFGNGAGWPGRADGGGSSLEWTGGVFTASAASNPAAWRASSEVHGSPGWEGAGPDQRAVVNEVLTHTDLPHVDAIEVKNLTASNLSVGGWYLADSIRPETEDDYRKFRIPAGTDVGPLDYLSFDETAFSPNGLWNPTSAPPAAWEFRLDAAHGDDVWLIEANASNQLVRFVDHAEFGAARNGESLGRWPDGTGIFLPMRTRTLLDESSTGVPRRALGASNGLPRVGPVLVSEIHYGPNGVDSNGLQFVEFYNAGTSNEPLDHWTLRGLCDFDFSAGQMLVPSQALVVVAFDPANAPLSAAFRSAYGIGTNVALAGPWRSGDVLRAGGRVELSRADEPPAEEPGFYPQIYEDAATYTNASPWPVTSPGGFSLTRRGTGEVAEISSSWKAAIPSPGRLGLGYASWQQFHFPTGGVAAAAASDGDGDGLVNAWEYAAGRSPWNIDPPGLLQADEGGFRFSVPADRPDAVVRPEFALTLDGLWTETSTVVLSNDLEVAWLRVLAPPEGTNVFLRLRLDLTP